MDWNLFIKALREIPGNPHRLMPPCPLERIKWVEERWGSLPPTISSMLNLFNGADLFIRYGPMLTILGISLDPPLPRLVWPMQYCMDYYMDSLRSMGSAGWPMAWTNYGSFWILEDNIVREWEGQYCRWSGDAMPFTDWIPKLIEDGKNFMLEEY